MDSEDEEYIYCSVCDELCYNEISFHTKYAFNNISIDEIDNIIGKFVTTHNKNFDYYQIGCEFEIQFHNNYTSLTEITYHSNTQFFTIKNQLLFCLKCCKSQGFKFKKINQMNINMISCMCSITYENYIKNPMPMVERRINFLIAKNPKLINSLDRNTNHLLIRKYSHIPFNDI